MKARTLKIARTLNRIKRDRDYQFGCSEEKLEDLFSFWYYEVNNTKLIKEIVNINLREVNIISLAKELAKKEV